MEPQNRTAVITSFAVSHKSAVGETSLLPKCPVFFHAEMHDV
ncbi:MAG: hypothetical protein QOE06_3665 [Thermoleophilaceae bacterium]|nr:hypothetical protein [Thermoleophilaceae bacterium]